MPALSLPTVFLLRDCLPNMTLSVCFDFTPNPSHYAFKVVERNRESG